MTTRRLLEVWQGNQSIEFRGRLTDPDVTAAALPLLVIRMVQYSADWCLEPADVEELHQFTYDLLAGPTRDPRLDRVVDAQIMCGERTHSPANGDIECCLFDGHLRVGDFDHITATGVRFDTPGF